ncbi:hypothetical protein MUY21_07810 [Aliiroseovarius sp. S2029]|uniref:methyltransferase family protein n=1 Tax=Aliiroseovarius sp. S2029 TaxID=2936988 RepID=UPI0020C14ADC|nr:hypothetical protein [Aliiroseovarius sp. S2029]MCK8483939.1 hypothetical protein [Aliiroseovarius sp. S2029]
MQRFLILLYAIAAYAAFLTVFLWFAAFLLGLNTIQNARLGLPIPLAAGFDVALIALFGLVHSVMARPGFKRVWTRIIPTAAERSTFVLQSSILLGTIIYHWQPIGGTVWCADGMFAAALYAAFFGGMAVIVLSTFALDHFEFTGLRQAWSHLRGHSRATPEFRTPWLYRVVRHPLQLGLVLMLFCRPTMTVDGLLLAGVMLAYILIGLTCEERDLVREFGADYRVYQKHVPKLVPRVFR